jgi:tetraacyldisaccharide 4'-kinase
MTLSRPLRILLRPFSLFFGLAASARARLYTQGFLKRHRLKAPVISVGNLSVGGTGKTPLVIWLAEKFLAQNKRVAILTRGYRGRQGTSDEVELMRARLQNRVRFGVGPDRYAEGQRLESAEPVDIFLLDDGFQHLQLARDVDILLLDSSQPMNQPLLPAGPMREKSSAMARANILVFTRTENSTGAKSAIQSLGNLPIFAASTVLKGFRRFDSNDSNNSVQSPTQIGSGPFLAFCGIGNPNAFIRDLHAWRTTPQDQLFFPDHHRYTSADAAHIEQVAKRISATALLTTEKDSCNLTDVKFTDLPVYVAIIDLQIARESEFLATLDQLLHSRGAAA